MNLKQTLERFKNNSNIMSNVVRWECIPAREAAYAEFPDIVDEKIKNALKKRSITKLYTHQAHALLEVNQGKDIVVVTPTASGKTLCYNIPVLNQIIKDDDSRALFLFPTKALAQDQMMELHGLITETGVDVKTYTYDGDTPQSARQAIRKAGHIVVTNPDMLHSGILPHHTKWTKLFENLKYVVIDEVHHYRGVFGSNVANVIRRLDRICEFYGSSPIFICCSATIANPRELVSKITGRNITVVDDNGAPTGEKHMIFYNPPVVNKQLGIRKSSTLEARKIAEELIKNGIQTIIFARSRILVEVLTTYLKDIFRGVEGQTNKVRGYRGGYLPQKRREIERGLRDGSITGVVTTNAMELGIDIGHLDACVICGYPGTIASTWQQAGRAGRHTGVSAVFIIANSSPVDQYIMQHPEYFLGKSPENGLVSPDNLVILYNHMKCAAFELPFKKEEMFGVNTTDEMLSFMEEAGLVRGTAGRWYWSSDTFPSNSISLRSASNENFIIIDISVPKHLVIGETDRFSAPMLLHEEAIYIHEGVQYQVEKLDYEEKKAFVRKVDVDYYTDANLAVELKVIDVFREGKEGASDVCTGEVMVTALVTMFKKVKLYSHENIGAGPVNLPEMTMHTTAYWFVMPDQLEKELGRTGLQNGLSGLSSVLSSAAPIYLMCDPKDISVVYQTKSPFTKKPTVFIYENCPGGVGFSDKIFDMAADIMRTAEKMIQDCTCDTGCPSCVGPASEYGGEENPKKMTLEIIKSMTM